MTNITRYDPFALDDVFDDLFKGYFVKPMRYERGEPLAQFKMDVTEDDRSYTVHAELPGVNKDDIHVTIDGNQVAISAEVKKESQRKEGEKVLRSERYYGKVYRAFSLGGEVDEARATAKYADGVLDLTLPKKAATAAKKLTIS